MKNSFKISLLLIVTMLFFHCSSVFAFTANDIAGHWAEKTILQWQDSGKISGYDDNTFRPDAFITRAELIHLLHDNITPEQNTIIHFNDVAIEDWYYDDISKAASCHIISGFEDNTFRPNEMVTRAQAALILNNILHIQNDNNSKTVIDEKEIPNWAKNAVHAMLSSGYLCGYEDGSFGANKNMTRAEAISMLDRINKNKEQNNHINHITSNTNDTFQNNDTTEKERHQKTQQDNQKSMVWKKDSSSKKDSKKNNNTEENKKTESVVITNQNIFSFYGKTISDDVKIILEDTMTLINITFSGNIEIICNEKENFTSSLILEGTTNMNHVTVFSPIIITSENNNIETLISKSAVTLSGNTNITNLQCYDTAEITDNSIIKNAEIHSNLLVDKNTQMDVVEIIPNDIINITANGMVNAFITKEKGTISSIHLQGNADSDINITDSVTVENITLTDNAVSHVTIQESGELKQFVSFSQCPGSTINNKGIAENIIVLDTETLKTENAVIQPAVIQNIMILSQPSQLHYKEGEKISLNDISLLLQYQQNITQIINDKNDFSFYHIKTKPDCNTKLTAAYHNKPIQLYGDTVFANTDLLKIDYTIKPQKEINTKKLSQLVQNCKILLQNTLISDTGEEIEYNQYYINKIDFDSFENTILLSEQFLLKTNITQIEVQKQYDILQTALHEFESKRIQKTVASPVLSVSNVSPEYGEEITFTIENMQPDTSYYYTLDNSEPNSTNTQYIEAVTLLPPEQTTENTVTIKAIAIENDICSIVSEKTIHYAAAIPIKKVTLSDIKVPFVLEQPSNSISAEEQYTIESFCWKSENEYPIDVFQGESIYTAEIVLKSNLPYIFEQNTTITLQDIPENKIQSICIDENCSDNRSICILITFNATPPLPTEELAKEFLEEFIKTAQNENGVNILFVFVPSSELENQNFCEQAISESAQQFALEKSLPEYWEITYHINVLLSMDSSLSICNGTFSATSTIDSSISAESEQFIDINIHSIDSK